jgi:hypothetical protein
MQTQKNFLLGLTFLMTTLASFAFDPGDPIPRWTSDKGWWVVESNIHNPRQHTIYFYNRDGVQVYKERLEGIRLNLRKAEIKMQLKQVLEASVIAWEKQHTNRENEALVMNRLRKK